MHDLADGSVSYGARGIATYPKALEHKVVADGSKKRNWEDRKPELKEGLRELWWFQKVDQCALHKSR